MESRLAGHAKGRILAILVAVGAVLALATSLVLATGESADGAAGDLRLVTRQSDADGGTGANSWSYGGSLSASGRFVAFSSEAGNLGVHDAGAFRTIYVKDMKSGRVETVSRGSNLGLGADTDSRQESISANGRYVVFQTEADNLGGPIVANENIYVYDRKRDKVELISRRSKRAGGGGADANSDVSSISGDGRYVTYYSRATNLSPLTPDDGTAQVYLYDRKRKRTALISRSTKGKVAKENAFDPTIAANAPVVLFTTAARNLGGPIRGNASFNAYVHNFKTGKTILVSRRSGRRGKGVNESASGDLVSGNGRRVLFTTDATNLGPNPSNQDRPYIRDLKRHKTTPAVRQSRKAGGKLPNADVSVSSISLDARYVAFQTAATNLGGPIEADYNVYVYDRKRKRVIFASRASGGGGGANEVSYSAALAGRAPFVTFNTEADDIDPPGEPAYHGNFPPATNVYRFEFRP